MPGKKGWWWGIWLASEFDLLGEVNKFGARREVFLSRAKS